jgi:hypothetical protein
MGEATHAARVAGNHQPSANKESFMRLELDEQAWNRGFGEGRQGKSLHSNPYEPGATESWS